MTPQLHYSDFEVEVKYINNTLGLDLDVDTITNCIGKMGLKVKQLTNEGRSVLVEAPPTRSDVMHACDVAEDVGIAYGYNNIVRQFPPTNTTGKQIPLNKFTDLFRHEIAQAGYIEVLTMSLLSIKENYLFLRRPESLLEKEAVVIANPKTVEFEVVRTTLVPGLLKTYQSNMSESVS